MLKFLLNLSLVFVLLYLDSTKAQYNTSISQFTHTLSAFTPTNVSLPNAGTWTGKAGDGNWNNANNWWGKVVPSSSTNVFFDYHYCGTNCDVIKQTANVSVYSVTITPNYPGTITQSQDISITLSGGTSSGWTQYGGIFIGSNASFGGFGTYVKIYGGSFKATSGNTSLISLTVTSPGIFLHNNGTVVFNYTSGAGSWNVPTDTNFYNVSFSGNQGLSLINNVNVLGNLTFNGAGSTSQFNGRTISLSGNLTCSSRAFSSSSATIKFTGQNGDQAITGTSPCNVGNIIIDSSSSVTLSGQLTVNNFTHTASSSFTSTGSTLTIAGTSFTTGGQNYNNITFSSNFTNSIQTVTNSLIVQGNLLINRSTDGKIDGASISVNGDVTTSAFHTTGTSNITMTGNTTANLNTNGFKLPGTSLTINKTGANVILTSTYLNSGQALTITSGSLDMNTFAMTLANISLSSTSITKSGGTLTVGGSIIGSGSLYGGTINP